MIDQWLQSLSELLSQNLWLGLILALVAGVLTSFTPCALSSVPLVIGYVSGYSDDKKKALFYSLMFCVGLTVTLTAIGVVAALIGRLFLGIQTYWYILLGTLMALMTLQTWEVINILPKRCGYTPAGKKKGVIGAILMGMLGALFSSPCSTPVLLAIVAVVSTGQSVVLGALMLLLYSVGHSVLLLFAGTSVGWITELKRNPKFEKAGKIINAVMGCLLWALSLYLFYIAFS